MHVSALSHKFKWSVPSWFKVIISQILAAEWITLLLLSSFINQVCIIFFGCLCIDIARQTQEIELVQSWLAFEPKINVFSLPKPNTCNCTSPQTRITDLFSHKPACILCALCTLIYRGDWKTLMGATGKNCNLYRKWHSKSLSLIFGNSLIF